jgi:hypothetical protein
MRIPFYNKKDLIAAFEFGVLLTQTMKEMDKEITLEIMERAEKILVGELSKKSHKRFVLDTMPNLLASIEPK